MRGQNWWFKWHNKALQSHDLMGRLNEYYRWRFVECCTFANMEQKDGVLPEIDNMAFVARVDPDTYMKDLQHIAEVSNGGLIHWNDEEQAWVVTNFAHYQDPIPDYKRKRAQRERERMQWQAENGEDVDEKRKEIENNDIQSE